MAGLYNMCPKNVMMSGCDRQVGRRRPGDWDWNRHDLFYLSNTLRLHFLSTSLQLSKLLLKPFPSWNRHTDSSVKERGL